MYECQPKGDAMVFIVLTEKDGGERSVNTDNINSLVDHDLDSHLRSLQYEPKHNGRLAPKSPPETPEKEAKAQELRDQVSTLKTTIHFHSGPALSVRESQSEIRSMVDNNHNPKPPSSRPSDQFKP